MDLRTVLATDTVNLHLKGTTKEEIINEMLDILVKAGKVTDKKAALECVLDRERKMSTGMKHGIAIPHAKSWAVTKPLVVIATLDKAIDFGAPDGKDCDLVCLIASPDDGNLHLDVIGRLSLILNDKDMQAKIRNATSASHLVELISNAEKALG